MYRAAKITSVSFLLSVFCLFLCPKLAFGDDGVLGRASEGSARITVVVPEIVRPGEVKFEEGRLKSCGDFSPNLSFLSVSKDATAELKSEYSTDCKTGVSFTAPITSGEAAIFVPSSSS